VASAAAGAQLVGSPTSDKDDEWRAAARGAIRIAREVGARVVLGDVSTRSYLTTPYLAGGPAADTDLYSSGEGPVGRAGLEALGRHYLVGQLDEAADAGFEASAWLATEPGIKSLSRARDRSSDMSIGPDP
jgi:hypothetical protein